jgi:hypothetical protein
VKGIRGELCDFLVYPDPETAGFGKRIALHMVYQDGEIIEFKLAFDILVGFVAFAVELVEYVS